MKFLSKESTDSIKVLRVSKVPGLRTDSATIRYQIENGNGIITVPHAAVATVDAGWTALIAAIKKVSTTDGAKPIEIELRGGTWTEKLSMPVSQTLKGPVK